jgi:acetoin utilization deacetylase AcuC-like enzyme
VASYRPQLVLISAGYDAHRDDPLAGCTVTEAGYAGMAAAMREACLEVGAPIGCVLEGGYALGALAQSVAATIEALSGGGGQHVVQDSGEIAERARQRVARYWPELAAA